jgi:hypothetical protein
MLRAFLVIGALLLTSCNWAEPPLPEPNADRDPRLLGAWHAKDRKVSLLIAPLEEKKYRITIGSEFEQVEFIGYHTDIEGIRVISLELQDTRLGDGRAPRWLLISYRFAEDGRLSPHFLAREVLPQVEGPKDYVKHSGKEIYASLSGAAKSEYYRAHFFDNSTEKIVFEKEANQPLKPTRPSQRADLRR